jgi:pyruvate/2-oxoglutarate dehydrogenase complex dihydrolipoamide dehydrogenase (E3) component
VVNLAVLQGEVAGHNASRPAEAPRLVDDRVLPRAVFTDPQFARVGLSRAQCEAAGLDFVEASQELASLGVARIYPRPVRGFLAMRAAKAGGLILGAELVAPEASLMIHDLVVAMTLKGTAGDLAEIPYLHPCLAEITPSVAERLARLVNV